jgi:hypothetical protein
LSLAAVLASGVIVSVPAPTLAAGSYPVYSVSVRYYPMYTANTTVLSDIVNVGCSPDNPYSGYISVGCALAGTVLAIIPSNQFSGYWADYVLQTSQVFVHGGAVCNTSKTNCSGFWKWDVYLKAAYLSQNNTTYSYLTSSWAPAYYGYSSIGYSSRAWWVNSMQLANILAGNGL